MKCYICSKHATKLLSGENLCNKCYCNALNKWNKMHEASVMINFIIEFMKVDFQSKKK